jgi:hypothetical protein
VIFRETAFTRIVRKSAFGRTLIHRPDRWPAECSKTHGGNVEHGEVVWLRALRPPDGDTHVLRGTLHHRAGCNRVFEERVPLGVHIQLGAERLLVIHGFRTFVNDRSCVAVEGSAIGVGFDEVLVELGTHVLDDEPEVPDDREVPCDAVLSLGYVVEPENHQRDKDDLKNPPSPIEVQGHGYDRDREHDHQPERFPAYFLDQGGPLSSGLET